ncbi:MAG: GNAT family N-acetyltransferase [Lachnospiraceae bacterium]|nr:GNAT family N-acetyltransferase [Lachnospiraceae bacterium]
MDKNIRKATKKDISRIAELMVINYRVNFFQFFKNEEFYFGELNVLDVAQEYMDHPEMVENTYVYDDGAVKGMVRLDGDEIVKLFVEPQFQSQHIGAKLLKYAVEQHAANWLWVLEYNARGIAFYKRNGFELTGEKFLEEGWIPLLKMQCE